MNENTAGMNYVVIVGTMENVPTAYSKWKFDRMHEKSTVDRYL